MRIFNTQTRRKEEFVPLIPGKARIYSCGPTVYNYFHIGNARPFIVFDTLRRHLERQGYEVTFVQNFTDIDDKMIRRAAEDGTTVRALGERFIAEYYQDADALGIRRATINPKATEHIPEIVTLIQRLEEKGLAYASGGDVYFDAGAFPGYGKLCGQNLEDLEAGARIEVGESKRHPMDFALWKAQKPGEPAWDSPWGSGRPGWHIECSAMSMKYLGDTIDIHCGGQDLIFPHHENEIAQSEGATGKPFARYWMHNGFINIDDKKMSKSEGNFFTVRDIARKFDLEAVRMFMLSAHYRSPVNFSAALIEQARSALERLYTAREHYRFLLRSAPDRVLHADEEAFVARVRAAVAGFDAAMDDDLNTADALGSLFEMVRDANTVLNAESAANAVAAVDSALVEMTGVLGLLVRREEGPDEAAQRLADARAAARAAKDWQAADRLRDELKALGYMVEDTPQGQKLRKLQ
jgi:cysteinyl-tRNA synthetase